MSKGWLICFHYDLQGGLIILIFLQIFLSRNAGKREITKAYRKLAQKWHPDNFQGEEKKAAEKKFIDIASAKEVLTDPEKRSKFDAGEDPLDPDSQSSQFSGFGHGFPFQFGGGRTFTFTFG